MDLGLGITLSSIEAESRIGKNTAGLGKHIP